MSSSIPRPKFTSYRRCYTPTVIQMEAAECGAAALSIVMGYYGHRVSLDETRTMCATSRDGVNAFNILRAAESYGLKSEGYRCELEELYEAPLPVIAFWNFDHFVVIEGFSKKHVYINDPASGPRTISYEELNRSFTGVILTFSPTESFEKLTMIDPSWKSLWQHLKLFRWPILFSVLTGILALTPTLSLTVLSQVFIDNIVIARIHSWEWGIIIGLLLMTVLATVIQFLQSFMTARFSIQLSTLLSSQFIWRILRLPILFFIQRYGGEIASRMSLNQAVADTFVDQVLSSLISLWFAFVFALVMFYYDVPITLIGLTLVFLNLIIMTYLYRSRANAYANYRQIQGQLASFTIGGLENVESLKAVGGEYQFIGRYGGLYAKSLNTLQNMGRVDLILGTLSPFFSALGSLAVLGMGAWRIIQGYLTVGEFFALQILFKSFTDPVLNLVGLNQTLQLLSINTTRINDVLQHPIDPALKREEVTPLPRKDDFQGHLEVKDLSFGFNPLDQPFLENIHLSLHPGAFVALVGPSGCGKSTLIKLIGGLLKPWQGKILIDGIPQEDYSPSILARSLSFVEQIPMLFTDSVEKNLNLMNAFIDQYSLVQAAQDACIHDEIMLRPGGYQALVEKQGFNFSGGQRQRLEIACALARNPKLLILDEATSAIDSIKEKQILLNIRKRGCACLIITHRLNAIRDCDMIFVMDKGRIVQRGTHHDLMQEPGMYQSLVESTPSKDES